jgi:hypothetical protein
VKIISPFQDYYDHAIHASQIDERIRYVRKTSIVPLDKRFNLYNLNLNDSLTYDIVTETPYDKTKSSVLYITALLTIGSKAFTIVTESQIDREEKAFHPQSNGVLHRPWGFPSREVYQKNYTDYLIQTYNADSRIPKEAVKITMHERARGHHYNWATRTYEPPRDIVLDQVNYNTSDICLHYQTPVLLVTFVHDGHTYHNDGKAIVILNPPLKAFNMMHVIDPFQTWQEISMWIGGIMPGQCSPMVELTDTSKLMKAGFDPKWGFRKRPEVK